MTIHEKDTEFKNRDSDNNIAYIMYTSGSTGVPKGVIIENKSITNQFLSLIKKFKFKYSLNHILMAPLTFDPAIQQIFLPLITGGKLFIIKNLYKIYPKKFWNFVFKNKINVINTVPSLMNFLVENVKIISIKRLKYLILAGETLNYDLYEKISNCIKIKYFINIYGPTEACINTTSYLIKKRKNKVIPIGKPLDNYETFIFDKERKCIPIGTIGELYISGIGLATGYVNNIKQTKESFITHQLKSSLVKLYRTGDLCFYDFKGNIYFKGRTDNQIKINGMRIEIDEIENVLKNHNKISNLKIIHITINNSNVLVAFIVTNFKELTPNNIYNFLEARLPKYMIPSRIFFLTELPLNPNGKIDVKKLKETFYEKNK